MTMMKGESTEQLLIKCSRLKARDYRNQRKNSLECLEELLLEFEKEKTGFYQSLKPIGDIIRTIQSSIDRTHLWKLKGSKTTDYQQQLALIACRLFKCLCQFDAENATNEQGRDILRTILQWLREDIHFQSVKFSQDLPVGIYSCLESYSLICQNQDEFLNELFSTTTNEKVRSSCLTRKKSSQQSLSIIDYTTRLLIYLLESSLVTSALLINQIFTFLLIYAPVQRFSLYLFNHTDFYSSTILPLLLRSNSDYFVQCIINETAQSQIDSTDRVFIFTHMINLLAEFVMHPGIEIHSSAFVPTFKQLFDSLIECGTTVPLWYFLKCLSNLLTNSSIEANLLAQEMHRVDLINSIVCYTSNLIEKSTLGTGQLVFKQLHYNVLSCCLSILYNLSDFDRDYLPNEMIVNKICRPLLKSKAQLIRLLSCILYSNLLSEKELQSDQSPHHLAEQLFSAIHQAFLSANAHFYNQISLFTLINCLKKLCTHREFQKRLGQSEEDIQLLFQILRQSHTLSHQQEETQILLEILWFLTFDYQSARNIHSHDKYFALLVQLAETNPNERIQQAAKGILWQLRQTLSNEPPVIQPPMSSPTEHIMFSYNHDSKELVEKLCQSLRNAGYRVWIDLDDMHGSTLECMAEAVEQASVVLICMTEKYKQSPNCQSEAEYVHRLEKPFVPILLQAKYRPNGWLGMLVGTRLYIDFTKRDYPTNVRKLVEEIEAVKN